MKIWIIVLVTLALMVAAPRAAGAGIEVTGLGGPMVVGGDLGGLAPSGSLRLHMAAGPSLSYGLEGGVAGLFAVERYYTLYSSGVFPGPDPLSYSSAREQRLAWIAASLKARAGTSGGARLYGLMFAGITDHMNRGPGPLPLETDHAGRFTMGIGGGLESPTRFGPVFEARTFVTGLVEGVAGGLAVNLGIRMAP